MELERLRAIERATHAVFKDPSHKRFYSVLYAALQVPSPKGHPE